MKTFGHFTMICSFLQLAVKSGVEYDSLCAWYDGPNPDATITTHLRRWVKQIVDKHQQAAAYT
jgi:hypothetical protein